MKIRHRITGYDRATDAMVEQHELPPRLLPLAKNLARVASDDPDAVWSYPLTDPQVQLLATAMHVALDPGRNEYFLEALAPANVRSLGLRRRAG